MNRITFLSHFVLCLACTAAAFFAWRTGVFTTIWSNDKSMMTSAIGALLIGTLIWLGRQAWYVADPRYRERDSYHMLTGKSTIDASFGHLAERLAVMMGFVGTAIGLSLQASALAAGAASFGALATSLFTTACGGVAAAVIALATFILETGAREIKR